jgi:hypothetical protein
MYRKSEIILAETILQLDKKRDELYEDLMNLLGGRAQELLRTLQNH